MDTREDSYKMVLERAAYDLSNAASRLKLAIKMCDDMNKAIELGNFLEISNVLIKKIEGNYK